MPVWSGDPSDILYILEFVFVVLMGLCFGSFATMMGYRGVIVSSAVRSQCPKCKTSLSLKDLFPLFSWLIQKGCCRYCGDKIPASYPLTELTVVLMGVSYFLVHGFDPVVQMLCVIAASSMLVALAVYDFKHKILPNQMMLILFVLGLMYRFSPMSAWEPRAIEFLGGAVLYAAISFILGWLMKLILKKSALGMGDVKFFGVAGLWLGILNLGMFCILSGFFGVILGLFWQRVKKEAVFPFGPALIAAFYIVLMVDGSHLP